LSNSTSPAETGIYIWHYADAASVPKKLKLLDFNEQLRDFHPLGIEYQPASQTITILNLASSASRIETFKLFASETAANFLRTLEHPQLSAPNSVVAIGDTEYLITNDHYFSARSGSALTTLETYLGVPGGGIVYVKYDSSTADKPSVVKSLARLNFANGVALLNETTVAVASSGLASVSLYTISKLAGELAPKLTYYREVHVPFHADNLSVDGNGKLLIAGHPHAPSTEEVAKNAARCNSGTDQAKEHCGHHAPSGIAEWSEQAGLKTLYLGFDYESSTTALRDVGRQVGLAVGLYAKGVMTWVS
jgi:arylesterase / paraoxonase